MKSELPGQRVLALARRLLSSRDVERVFLPAVADLQHEWLHAREPSLRTPIVLAAHVTLVGLLVRLVLSAAFERALSTSLRAIFFAGLTAGIACVGLAPSAPEAMKRELFFVVLGCASALAATTTRSRWISAAAVPGAVGALLMLLVVACFGIEEGGTRRWLSVGGLSLHVAAWCVAPVVVGIAAALFGNARRGVADVMVVAVGALAVATQDPVPALQILVGSCVAAAMTKQLRLALLAALAMPLFVFAAPSTMSAMEDVPHVTGAFATLAAHHPGWAGFTALALMATLVVPVDSVRALHLSRGPSWERTAAAALASALFVQPALAMRFGDGVHLVAFGGSGVVATFLALAVIGVLVRDASEPDPTVDRAHLAPHP